MLSLDFTPRVGRRSRMNRGVAPSVQSKTVESPEPHSLRRTWSSITSFVNLLCGSVRERRQ